MKRIHIINHPQSVSSISDIDADAITGSLELKAERLQTRRMRQFNQQYA